MTSLAREASRPRPKNGDRGRRPTARTRGCAPVRSRAAAIQSALDLLEVLGDHTEVFRRAALAHAGGVAHAQTQPGALTEVSEGQTNRRWLRHEDRFEFRDEEVALLSLFRTDGGGLGVFFADDLFDAGRFVRRRDRALSDAARTRMVAVLP